MKPFAPSPPLTEADLRFIALMETSPRRTVASAARQLKTAPSTVWRQVARLRASGVIRPPEILPPGTVVAHARIKSDLARADLMAALERRLRADPRVARAQVVCGPHDYEVESRHDTPAQAKVWRDGYASDPAVRRIDLQLVVRQVIAPRSEAAALLAGRPGAGG